MDILSLAGFLVLYGIIGALGIYILFSMFTNMKYGRKYFEKLAVKLQSLRLNRMLSALGIDTKNYLATQRKIDIERHMRSCSNCKNTDECDKHLASGDIDADSISYCNNEKELQEISLKDSPNKPSE